MAEEQLDGEGWGRLLEIAAQARGDDHFDKNERTYKLEIAEAVASVLSGPAEDVLAGLRRTWQQERFDGYPYNLTNWRQNQWFTQWAEADDGAIAAAQAFADVGLDAPEAFERFSSAAEAAVTSGKASRNPGAVLGLGSVFAFAFRPHEVPIVRAMVFENCERTVGYPTPPSDPATARYRGHLEFADEARGHMEDAGIPIRDALDVQSLLYIAAGKLGKEEEVVEGPALG